MAVSKTPQRATSPIALDTLIELFLTTRQIEGCSQKTLTWYKGFLVRFAGSLEAERGPATLAEVTLANARAFIAHLQGKATRYADHDFRPEQAGGLSPRTIHAYVRTLKTFGNWLHEEGFVPASPFERLKRPKQPQTMIEVLSENEIAQLIGCIKPDTMLGARAHAMVLLMLDTGIRASELCALRLSDTHLKAGYIKVLGKGSKERMAPFGRTTKKSLIRYVHAYRPGLADENIDELFLTLHGTPLKYAGLAQVFRRLSKASGIPRLHAHLCRHTFAVRYLMNGGDVMTLRLILGHTSLDVTQMYLRLAESHVQVQHSKFSPIDRLGNELEDGRSSWS